MQFLCDTHCSWLTHSHHRVGAHFIDHMLDQGANAYECNDWEAACKFFHMAFLSADVLLASKKVVVLEYFIASSIFYINTLEHLQQLALATQAKQLTYKRLKEINSTPTHNLFTQLVHYYAVYLTRARVIRFLNTKYIGVQWKASPSFVPYAEFGEWLHHG